MRIKHLDFRDIEDVRGSLESIMNLAAIGLILLNLSKVDLIPTILEYLFEHSQRLTMEYSTVEENL